ncbi:glycerol kinase GlpK [Weissella diestrammenae]|uniref:glycerol kinase n=1 Tax=Weissella diestrammenae TaxID=1162633 RepID=A0A7G9T4Z4_9LACO|nr:glycerol kinase GlpK [Weissella diestrammenae]MCM0582891.1 glycerol kinase GlpK [Weissella diestrammenae]QNN75169.1 glycerol kinase GlpK [Weissella diestrammenae]
MENQYVMVIDQGTTSTRVVLYDHEGMIVEISQLACPTIRRHTGWVEHDANQIWQDTKWLMQDVLTRAEIQANAIKAIGITNQRETTVIWDKETGQPVSFAIGWQSTQSEKITQKIKQRNITELLHTKTGLWLDSYFSATKVLWAFDEIEDLRLKAANGQVLFGTMDTWLLWQLTKGQVHGTDVSNASRTMMFNIHTLQWDDDVLEQLKIPRQILPDVYNSADDFGCTELNGVKIPITAIAGDQQAALFGHQAFEVGAVKSTYGTGAFMMMNTGKTAQESKHGLLTTIAYGIHGEVTYALEGSIFSAGSAIQWLKDEMQLIDNAQASSDMAYRSRAAAHQQIYLVPAFTGLGAPHWQESARGAAFGITRMTNDADVVRATVESLAFQTRDILEAMQKDTGIALSQLVIDGGVSANDYLHEFLADLLQMKVSRPINLEMTSLGIAFLAGLQSGYWPAQNELPINQAMIHIKQHADSEHMMQKNYLGWQKAVKTVSVFP